MKKTIKRNMHRLSLSSETLRRLTVPELARAQGGLFITVSYCVDVDEKTIVRHTIGQCTDKGSRVHECATQWSGCTHL